MYPYPILSLLLLSPEIITIPNFAFIVLPYMHVILNNKFCCACFWTLYNWNDTTSNLVWLLFPISFMLLRFIRVSEYSCSSFIFICHLRNKPQCICIFSYWRYLGCFQFYLSSPIFPVHLVHTEEWDCVVVEFVYVPSVLPLASFTWFPGYHWVIDVCKL